MTHAEWLASNDPTAMIAYVNDWLRTPGQIEVSNRKLRLILCGVARLSWRSIIDEDSHAAVLVAERLADGEATEEERRQAYERTELIERAQWGTPFDSRNASERLASWTLFQSATHAIDTLANHLVHHLSVTKAQQAALLRDVVGLAGTPLRHEPQPPTDGAVRRGTLLVVRAGKPGRPANRGERWTHIALSEPDGDGLIHTMTREAYERHSLYGAGVTPPQAEVSYITPLVLTLAQAAYHERFDNAKAIEKVKKDIDTQQFIMSRCTSDGAYRVYQKNIDGFNRRLAELRDLPSGTLDPQRLLVLADALEEAGCESEPLLRHLRGEEVCPTCDGKSATEVNLGCTECDEAGWINLRGPHVRGCWAIDLLLGKS